MIEPTTLARPYARAAFEHARAADQLGVWQASLAQLAALTADHKVAASLRHPDQTAAQRAATLMALAGESLPPAVGNLLHVLADNGRLALLPEVSMLFEQLKQSVESAVAVHVVSAYPLSEIEADQLTELRLPNIAEPTRICVAPIAIALSKSLLIPMDSPVRPFL